MQRGKAATRRQDDGRRDEPGRRRLRRARPATGSSAGARRRRDGAGRGTRPDHAAGGPQGPGELPRRAVGEPPGSRAPPPPRSCSNPSATPSRRAEPTHRHTKGRQRSTWPSTSSRSTRAQPRAERSSSTPTARSTQTANQEFPQIYPVARPRRARPGGHLGLAARGRQEGDRRCGRVARRHRRHRHHQPARDDGRLGQEHRQAGPERHRLAEPHHGRLLRRAEGGRPRGRSSATRPASRSTPTSAARRSATSSRTTRARRRRPRPASCCSARSTASSSGA